MFSSKGIVKRGGDLKIEEFLPSLSAGYEKRLSCGMKAEPAELPCYSDEEPSRGQECREEAEEAPAVRTDWRAQEAPAVSQGLSGGEDFREAMIREALQKARRLLRSAEQEAEALRKNAAEEGYREGYEKGLSEGRLAAEKKLREESREETESFREMLQETLRKAELVKQESLHRYLQELQELAVLVAEKVIHVSLASSGEVIRRMILKEAERLRQSAWLKIHISKTDYELLAETGSDMAAGLAGVTDSIQFVIVEKDKAGSMILETPEEIIDMSVSTQMENLRSRLGQAELPLPES